MAPTPRDDFAASARRHLTDAAVLYNQARWDGTVYLTGYVIECALKMLVERWLRLSGPSFSHRIDELEAAVLGDRDFELLVALSPTPRPMRLGRSAPTIVSQHHPNRRYFADGWLQGEAETALDVRRKFTNTPLPRMPSMAECPSRCIP